MGLRRAGFEVVGVDLHPQPHYPFRFIQGDALEVDLEGYDMIWASPPCQAYTAYRRKDPNRIGASYPDLIAPVRQRLRNSGVPYVIENVVGAPLIDPVRLCGSSFGLDVRRHRLFEASFPILPLACDHDWQTPRFPPATNRKNLRRTVEVGVWRIPVAVQQKAMGIDWLPRKTLTQAIPPAYSEYIGRAFIRHRDSVNP